MRYAAPAEVTSIILSIGPVPVVDGFVDVPDDLGAGDIGGLAMNGFVPAPAAPPPKSSALASKPAEASAEA